MEETDRPIPIDSEDASASFVDSSIPMQSEDASASLSLADIPLASPSSSRFADTLKENGNLSGRRDVESDLIVEEASGLEDSVKRRRFCGWPLLVIVLVLAVGCAVAITFGLTTSDSDSSSPSALNDASSTPDESVPPTGGGAGDTGAAPSERASFEDIVKYLSLEGVSSQTDLITSGSPQNKAARWLAEEDLAAVIVPTVSIDDPQDTSGYMFMVRYIMALDYHAFDGPGWLTQVDFMTGVDVCSWNGYSAAFHPSGTYTEIGGLQCDPNSGLPTILDLEVR
jgi:hypothetical protein